jgi:hypothetical protein
MRSDIDCPVPERRIDMDLRAACHRMYGRFLG